MEVLIIIVCFEKVPISLFTIGMSLKRVRSKGFELRLICVRGKNNLHERIDAANCFHCAFN